MLAMHTHTHKFSYTHTDTHIPTHTHSQTLIPILSHPLTLTQAHSLANTHTHTITHTYTHIHPLTRTHTLSHFFLPPPPHPCISFTLTFQHPLQGSWDYNAHTDTTQDYLYLQILKAITSESLLPCKVTPSQVQSGGKGRTWTP